MKAKRHGNLLKEKRNLQSLIENKPQKVVFDIPSNLPSIAPYLGLTQPKTNVKEEIQEPKKKVIKRNTRLISNGEYSEENGTNYGSSNLDDEEPSYVTDEEEERSSLLVTPRHQVIKNPIINPKFKDQFLKYIEENKDKLKISAGGKVFDYRNNTIKDSNYKEILKYMTGEIDKSPTGTKFLKERLMKEQYIKNLINPTSPMAGRGRKVKVRLQVIKTPGLIRRKKELRFKPTLWARI